MLTIASDHVVTLASTLTLIRHAVMSRIMSRTSIAGKYDDKNKTKQEWMRLMLVLKY